LTVTPKGEPSFEFPADADLELTGVVFDGDGVVPVTVETWKVEDVNVGWLPG
jgi:hypothetical protein